MDPATIAQIKALVELRRRRSLTMDEKMDILWLQATLREERRSDVTGTISRLLLRSNKTVKGVLCEFLGRGSLFEADPPLNTKNHPSRVPTSASVRSLVRTFIRDRWVTRTRTVAWDVLALLIDHNVVFVGATRPNDYSAGFRAVQVFLSNEGYARGKRAGRTEFRMTKADEMAWDAYFSMMVPTGVMRPRRPVVHLDESFIQHHYTRHEDSLYDPEHSTTRPKYKGRRFCLIAGIIDEGLDIFVGGKKNGKTVKDYHSMFNHAYFVDWFEKLLDEVENLGWASAVFVMDNPKYHKGRPFDTPKGNWKKDDLYQECVKFKVLGASSTDLKAMIWAALKKHIEEHIPPVVVEMARTRGHHVVFSAPGFSDLQPIEMVWANVKGTVGRAYTSTCTTTFAGVRDRLDRVFYELDTKVIYSAAFTAKLLMLDSSLREAETLAEASCFKDFDSETSSEDDLSASSDCVGMGVSENDE
ncbi:hypothetical protein H310_13913 [Aphanomyces invadans]|uniref:Tc1-like transposase DDE domain-containing protein n=1 Tax=Aphanomyces invadans TaxID=157072 RepID=A0A024TD69_9STRA|nr:hypothetical protein H310_13913 [Aphanomyces invadans]ETV91531.1 hypothetical protein H310_13913 [Aphanomyces invadans]|eukprot:XP_008879799.1 hypothetical protein H310_13913 [Aphanomyces invadans]